ncbi:MAG: M48 family metallopeptidase [Clostridiaceae bacterium]|nr:M48 family metallopeptidase [Clostridiaceae bacterium]
MQKLTIDQLIRSKRKTISLTITKDAKLVVRVPLRMPLKDINDIIEEKKDWIISKKEQVLKRKKEYDNLKFVEGGKFFFQGKTYTLVPDSKISMINFDNDKLYYPSSREKELSDVLKSWCRFEAKRFLPDRLNQLSELLKIPYTGCSITSARTRWGSCSPNNRINLTWRLIMADTGAIDYVIIHELCHVVHKNHGKEFWTRVQQIMPDYLNYRKWLKEHAYILDVFE